MKLLGIEIERRTDVLAMAAFLISAGSLLSQAAVMIRGPEARLDGPKQIVLFLDEGTNGQEELAAISNQFYINKGTPGYDDILKSEKLILSFRGRQVELKASNSVVPSSEGSKLVIGERTPWRPNKIPAGDVMTRETLYLPFPSSLSKDRAHNFISREELMKLLQRSSMVTVSLQAETYAGSKLISTCELHSSDIMAGIKAKGWSSLVC